MRLPTREGHASSCPATRTTYSRRTFSPQASPRTNLQSSFTRDSADGCSFKNQSQAAVFALLEASSRFPSRWQHELGYATCINGRQMLVTMDKYRARMERAYRLTRQSPPPQPLPFPILLIR
ncbi:MAG: hypothetical protein KAX37_07655 [Opitutaceae bacterium]|nr:hypothetical protein [Opitutaceae bacterium]